MEQEQYPLPQNFWARTAPDLKRVTRDISSTRLHGTPHLYALSCSTKFHTEASIFTSQKSLKLYIISDSGVFRPVEVPSRLMQNQNVNVNA